MTYPITPITPPVVITPRLERCNYISNFINSYDISIFRQTYNLSLLWCELLFENYFFNALLLFNKLNYTERQEALKALSHYTDRERYLKSFIFHNHEHDLTQFFSAISLVEFIIITNSQDSLELQFLNNIFKTNSVEVNLIAISSQFNELITSIHGCYLENFFEVLSPSQISVVVNSLPIDRLALWQLAFDIRSPQLRAVLVTTLYSYSIHPDFLLYFTLLLTNLRDPQISKYILASFQRHHGERIGSQIKNLVYINQFIDALAKIEISGNSICMILKSILITPRLKKDFFEVTFSDFPHQFLYVLHFSTPSEVKTFCRRFKPFNFPLPQNAADLIDEIRTDVIDELLDSAVFFKYQSFSALIRQINFMLPDHHRVMPEDSKALRAIPPCVLIFYRRLPEFQSIFPLIAAVFTEEQLKIIGKCIPNFEYLSRLRNTCIECRPSFAIITASSPPKLSSRLLTEDFNQTFLRLHKYTTFSRATSSVELQAALFETTNFLFCPYNKLLIKWADQYFAYKGLLRERHKAAQSHLEAIRKQIPPPPQEEETYFFSNYYKPSIGLKEDCDFKALGLTAESTKEQIDEVMGRYQNQVNLLELWEKFRGNNLPNLNALFEMSLISEKEEAYTLLKLDRYFKTLSKKEGNRPA